MPHVLRAHVLSRFTCLGDKCSDTCCKGWSMQVNESTLERYAQSAPELLSTVEAGDDGNIMRKDSGTGCCVKLEEGLCGIHKKYGDAFLGDACHFYPRVTRALGDSVVMTATLSCPEIARLALFDDDAALSLEPQAIDRLPQSLKNYLPEGLTEEEALAVHRAFLDATRDDSASAEQIFLRIATVARFLSRNDVKDWPRAAPFYLKNADSYIPAAETNDVDPFNLLHALAGLIVASHKPMSVTLKQTVTDMETALAVTLDWANVQIAADEKSAAAYRVMRALWKEKGAKHYDKTLKKILAMELSLALFPFSGFGVTLAERATVIGVRLATMRLAFMCAYAIYNGVIAQDDNVRMVQSLSRFMDHLGDAAFSLKIYAETGWIKESRMRGLLET